jgi:Holliday junction DNA helicase RuvA
MNRVTIEVQGVGYNVAVPLSTVLALPEDGEVFLHIHTVLRENALELYGFIGQDEKALFEMLLGGTGVGPRLALIILSGISLESFTQATLTGDCDRFTCIPGIGEKLAKRIVLELKDKITKNGIGSICATVAPSSSAVLEQDLMRSLINLGYKESFAKETVRMTLQECPAGVSLEQALKVCLKKLAP